MIDILKKCSQINSLTASDVEDHFISSLTNIGKKDRTVERILQIAKYEKDKVDLIRVCETQSGSVKSTAVKSYTAPVHIYEDIKDFTDLLNSNRKLNYYILAVEDFAMRIFRIDEINYKKLKSMEEENHDGGNVRFVKNYIKT